MLAPIALFVFNRPHHTLKTLEALSNNTLAEKSDLYIFCDGPRENSTDEEISNIVQVRNLVRKKNWCGKVTIVESNINKGLAQSIIDGVQALIEKSGKIIVLEDDLITSKGFLKFINDGLDRYENFDKVKQIAGFSYLNEAKGKSYFLPITTSWGWGMWRRAWDEIDFSPKDCHVLENDKNLRYKFNIDGTDDMASILLRQINGDPKINSWAIRMWWSIFKKSGLVLHPDTSLIKNIGFDGTGEHCNKSDRFRNQRFYINSTVSIFPNEINPDLGRFIQYKNNYRKSLQIVPSWKRLAKKYLSYLKVR